MNLEPSESQSMIATTFGRFFDEHSSMARVRAALPLGFDASLWDGLADLGAFAMCVPEDRGGLGLGLFDAVLVMEQAGRTLASGPIAEAIVAARLLAILGGPKADELMEGLCSGRTIVSLALRDAAGEPQQWIAGGAIADYVLARDGDAVVLVQPTPQEKAIALEAASPKATHNFAGEPIAPNLGSMPMARIRLDAAERTVLAAGQEAATLFTTAIEEWKLLTAAALAGLAIEAVEQAAKYAIERKAFGVPIGSYQGISHPLADLVIAADGGRYLVWKALRDIVDGSAAASAKISMALWWTATTASTASAKALHTFGGYGLTTDYDIHLFVLRAKSLALIFGDPGLLLAEAGGRLFAQEPAPLPEPGEISIDFDLGDDARALAAELDDFFRRRLTPERKAKAHFSYAGHDPDVNRELAAEGLLFPEWAPEYNGRNATPYAVAAAGEVYEEHRWSLHAWTTSKLVGWIIQRFGSEELKREALPRIVAGEAVCSLGFSEPSTGSDVFAAATRATRDGEGWRIDGQKMFTSGANIAEYVLLLARTDPDAPKHKGLTMFIVPLKAKGVEIHPIYTFQDERTNVTYYGGVQIPDSYRLGEVNGGAKVMAASLEIEHGSSLAKVQRQMLRAGVELCRRTQRGGRPLIEADDTIRRLARTATHIEVATVIYHRALWTSYEKRVNLGYGSASKVFSSEKFVADAADLLDLSAPESLALDDPAAAFLNQCFRHSQGTTIYGGTSEVHRSMVAERRLGLPRSRS